jgi:hypothetical protein
MVMANLITGTTVTEVKNPNGTVSAFIKDLETVPAHTNALTLKADGVLLKPSQQIPKDTNTLEIVETYDTDVVSDTPEVEVQGSFGTDSSTLPDKDNA